MGSSEAKGLPANLERLRQQFEHWRATHRARARISPALWAAAAKLAGSYGICRTAKTLKVDYYSLKEHVEQSASNAARLPQGTFLELPRATAANPGAHRVECTAECTVEWEDAAGSKMRVHLKGAAVPDLAALSQSFWNSRR